jgi:sialic acid synthase SpsE
MKNYKKFTFPKSKTYIIAEVGSNHNGSVKLAKKIIINAKKAGADAVKFQTFTCKSLYSSVFLNSNKKLKRDVEKFSLNFNEFKTLSKFCKKLGITFCATPFSVHEVDFLINLNVPFIKIASMDLNNYSLIEYIAKKKIPILLSTGLSTIFEIKKSINIIKKNNCHFALLHCVAEYPPSDNFINLPKIKYLKEKFNCTVGFSDHSIGIPMALSAVANGAAIIEKHFTYDKKLPGWDHSISADFLEMKLICDYSQRINKATKFQGINVVETKSKIQSFRRSLVASRLIFKGEVITKDLLNFKRPGTGFSLDDLKKILGKKAKKNISYDTIIKKNFLC